MSKIVFKHPASDETSLSVAGNFSQWNIIPMVHNTTQNQWEYQITDADLQNCSESGGQIRIYFKFIDGNSDWFTDENFAKEIDEHGNENNVMYLDCSSTEKITKNNVDLEDRAIPNESEQEGPPSPDPTPLPAGKDKNDEEPPVVISKSDVEGYEEAVNQDQLNKNADSDRPNSADTNISKVANSTGYKGLLQSIISFFRNLFYGWFGMGGEDAGSRTARDS